MYKAKSKARLYVSGALSTGAVVELTSGQLHYVARVMRIEAGDSVLLFNGHDGEWQATIQNISKKQCSLQVTEQTREQEKPFDVWLAFAPVKNPEPILSSKKQPNWVLNGCSLFLRNSPPANGLMWNA